MGIDVFVLDFLLDYKGRNLGDTLCLGRQGFHVGQQPAPWLRAKDLLALRFSEDEPQRLIQADGYSETFLRYLGAQSVTSLDFSAFEGAQLVYDLNKRIPSDLERRFDFIFDGGTLEHVFNFPMAIANVKSMLRVGGLFVSVNGANNQLGHGLYQFSPELFWRIFSQETGFVVENMVLVPMTGTGSPQRIELTDTAGRRQEIGATPGATYLMVAARRERSDILLGDIYQSDYEVAWGDRQRT
jgi:hypothetical protein